MKSYEEYYMEFMDSLFNRKKKQKGISIWAIAFFILFIAHLISYYWLLGITSGSGSTPSGMFLAVLLILLGLLFSIIDFIAVLLFIIIHKPHGMAKFISYIILIIVSWMPFYFGIGVVTVYLNPFL
jgi:hypothetical protein